MGERATVVEHRPLPWKDLDHLDRVGRLFVAVVGSFMVKKDSEKQLHIHTWMKTIMMTHYYSEPHDSRTMLMF